MHQQDTLPQNPLGRLSWFYCALQFDPVMSTVYRRSGIDGTMQGRSNASLLFLQETSNVPVFLRCTLTRQLEKTVIQRDE